MSIVKPIRRLVDDRSIFWAFAQLYERSSVRFRHWSDTGPTNFWSPHKSGHFLEDQTVVFGRASVRRLPAIIRDIITCRNSHSLSKLKNSMRSERPGAHSSKSPDNCTESYWLLLPLSALQQVSFLLFDSIREAGPKKDPTSNMVADAYLADEVTLSRAGDQAQILRENTSCILQTSATVMMTMFNHVNREKFCNRLSSYIF